MSDEKKKPSYEIIAVKDLEDGRSYYTKLGATFAHADGKGHSIDTIGYPAPGVRLMLRTPEDRIQEAKENSRGGDRRDERRSETNRSGREDRQPRDNGPRHER